MKPLIVLLITFVTALLLLHFIHGGWALQLPAMIGMSAMLLLTASGHFIFVKGMVMMLPPFIPAPNAIIYVTGVIEILAAIGLLIPSLRLLTAWCLFIFFILILPSNIYAATKQVDLQKATHSGPGLSYLWFRVPLQLFFLAWVYGFGING